MLVCILVACEPSAGPPGITVETRGSLRSVTIGGAHSDPVVRIDSTVTIWRSDALADPVAMAVSDRVLAVADEDRIHVVRDDGTHLTSFGRSGQGPGEFRRIVAVGWRNGEIVAFDAANARYTVFSSDGSHRSTTLSQTITAFVNPPRRGPPLRFWRDGVLRTASELVHTDRRGRTAVVWESLERDSVDVVESLDDVQWVDAGGLLVTTSVYPARALFAVAPDGRYAFADGQDYCVTVAEMSGPGSVTICRDRPRTPVGGGVRDPDASLIELPGNLRGAMVAALDEQEVDELRPSLDRLAFSESGDLWVRVFGSTAPDVHPLLSNWSPETDAWRRRWESYASNGIPKVTVEFPASFEPRVFLEHEALGFRELPTGEVVVARASWTPTPR